MPQSQRCETMPARLAPTPELPVLSGSSTPNSVATLGPVLSCRLPGTSTCLRNAPAAVRLVGPVGESGVWPWPSKTASQSFAEAVIDDRCRRDEARAALVAQPSGGLQFDFHLSLCGDGGIGAVKGAIGRRGTGPGEQAKRDHRAEARRFGDLRKRRQPADMRRLPTIDLKAPV